MLLSFVSVNAQEGIVAKIGNSEYTTFANAMTDANAATGNVTVEVYGTVEFVDGMELNGSYTSITFTGKSSGAQITINQTAGGDYLTAHGKIVAFKNLILAKANPAWSGNSGHMGNYFSVQGGTVTYTDCTFPNGACTNTGTAVYNNCTFQNASEYGLWVYDDALVTVNGGTIDSKKGIKVYSEGEESVTSTLTVQNTTFTENVTAKPAVAIGYAESITLIGNTYNNPTGHVELDSGSDADCDGIAFVAEDSEGNDISSELTVVDRSKSSAACGVLVDGKIYTTVTTAAAEATSGSTVTLLYSTTETVELPEGVTLDTNGFTADNVTVATSGVAKIGDVEYETLEEAFAAATEGETITLLADATPALTSQRAITKAAVIDLGGNTLTLTEDDLYFGTTTFKNGTIVVDPSVYASTAVFWMFANQTLTFDNVDIIATGLTGTYLIGINDGTGSSVNLLNGSSITIDNSEKAELSTVIADNGNGNSVIIKDSKIDVKNVDARLYLGGQNGSVTIENSDIVLNGVKEGFYLKAGQTLAINGTSKVDITLNADTKPRYGINMTDATATYTKAETATVNATVYAPAKGSNSYAYTREENGYVRVWGEGGGNAKESYELKLYSGETLIATTKLNNVGNVIDGDVYVTWNFYYPQSTDEYWTTTWEAGHPNSAAQPTEVELYIDGTLVATTAAKMSGADDVNPVVWRNLGGVAIADLLGEGTAENPYLIGNKKELLWFQAKVDEQAADGSTQFAGKYFKLTADIDLAGENWNPIGSMSGDHGSFKGVFDGGDHTISNLKVEQAGNGIGLFARTAGNAVIKNLKLNNVSVKSTDNSNYAGAVVGNAYASTKIENVHVSGNVLVSGRGYIGGIAGHGYVVMDNVSVVATGDGQGNDKGLITSTFWCAGGILGYGGEGATNIMNANVENVVVTSAAGGLGAIVGMAEDNNGTQPISGSNLSAKNVEIKTYAGAYGDSYANYALGYLYGGNPTSKLTGELSVENVTLATSNGVAPTPVDAVAKVNDAIYFSLQDALDAAAAGTGNVTVTILNDVDLTDVDWNPVTVSAPGYPVVTVEGNNKTITGLNDMLFAGTWAGGSGLIIKNLTIDESAIVNDKDDANGTVGVGAFIGFPQASATITLENCHLKNSSVEGGHWTGGLIGYAAGYAGEDGPVFMNLTVKNCSVTGSTITGKGSVGGIIGHGSGNGWTNVVIEETTVQDNTITSTGSSNVKAGAIMGTIGAAGQPTTANGVTKTGGASVSATVAGNTVTSNGTTITTIYGRQGTATGLLYVAGGSYDNYPIEQGVAYAAPVEGYKIVKNDDNTYGVVVDPAYGKVAMIGETYYETLDAAFAAAQDNDEVEIIAAGTYALTTSGKNITITGAVDGVVFDNIGAKNMGSANVTFNNVTFDYYPNVNYTGLQHSGNLKYNNCIINGQVFLYGTSETFNKCTFNQNSADAYNVWTYGAKEVAFNECTFNSAGKSVLVYTESATTTNDVTVTKCAFNASAPVEGKAAIEIDTSLSAGATITVDGETTATGFGSGNVSGNSLWNNKKGSNTDANNDITVVVNNETVLAPVTFVAKIGETGYRTLAEAFAAADDDETVTLLKDITYTKETGFINGEYVDGLVYTGDKNFTVDFAGHTVTENGDINDYLVYLKNTGENDNEITFKNGTIAINSQSTATAWAAITVGSNSSTHATTLNLDSMKVINGNPNAAANLVIRSRNGATVNLNEGTTVTSNGTSYGVVAEAASTLNINDGAKVIQQNSGTTGGNTVYTAVSGNGVINIYEGAVIESDKYGIHNMTTGNTEINIYGGTITAPVIVRAATNGGSGESADVYISGGTFYGAMEEYTNTANIHVSGGVFDRPVAEEFCAEGYAPCDNADGTYGVYYAVLDEVHFVDGEFTEFNNSRNMTVGTLTYERNFSTAWTPFYVPFEVPVSQLAEQGFEVAYINGVRRDDDNYDGELDDFVMEVIYIHGGNADGSAKTLKANYPYFIRSKEGTKLMDITLYDEVLYAAEEREFDCTTFTEKFVITGVVKEHMLSDFNENNYLVARGDDGNANWSNENLTGSLRPFRFYMTLTSRDGGAPVITPASMSIVVRGEELPDGTTLIYDINAETGDNVIYDLYGRRVLETEKGNIYIINGKKVLVK
ncbi:MAG: hypothetical protein J6C15_09150 [Bacteroidaceae bacterium]|nr:hypothetical protein [Bacteroidaceae bacterium]